LCIAQDKLLQKDVNAFLMQMSHEATMQLIDATQANETHQI
jgi:hypothetical protein